MKIGDKVKKRAGAGFVAEQVICIIPDVPENQDPDPCLICDDEKCKEWTTLYVINNDDMIDGHAYHVSDCQLELVK